MANEAMKETVNAQVAQEETPAATVEQQNAAPAAAETPKEPVKEEPVKEKKEHPKWDAFKEKAKKAAKWVGAGAALVGGLVIANKLGQVKGQAAGFDAACDAFAKVNPDPLPVLPELPEEIPAVDMTVADATCDTDLLQNP